MKHKIVMIKAFTLGFWEGLSSNGVGLTNPTDQDWNDAYDRGLNLADKLMGRTP